MKRICLALTFLMITVSVLPAARLPTKGVFKGIYHKDRSGIGSFSHFLIIDKVLQKRLEEYDGRYIEMEVLEGRQPENPGPAIADKIGYIKLLPQPLAIQIEDKQIAVRENTETRILFFVENKSDTDLKMSPGDVGFVIGECGKWDYLEKKKMFNSLRRTYHLFEKGEMDEDFTVARTNYRSFHSFIEGQLRSPYTMIGNYEVSAHNSLLGCTVKAGSRLPFVLVFSKGLPAGKYDISLHVRTRFTRAATWITVTSGKKEAAQEPELSQLSLSYRKLDNKKDAAWIEQAYEGICTSLYTDMPGIGTKDAGVEENIRGDWVGLALMLKNNSGKERFIPVSSDRGGKMWFGQMFGHTASGKSINLIFNYRHPPQHTAHMVKIPKEGQTIKFHFRQPSYFPDEPLVKLSCQILTDRGLESFVIEPNYEDAGFNISPVAGPPTNGVTSRIRTDQETYTPSQIIHFYLQLTNTTGKPICWLGPPGGYFIGKNAEVLIDGKSLFVHDFDAEETHGWECQDECNTPIEQCAKFCAPLDIAPGKHTLTYKIISDGDADKASEDGDIPALNGTLISNTVEFTVKEQ